MAIELTQEIGRRITTITEDTRKTTFLFHAFPWLSKEEMRFLFTTPWSKSKLLFLTPGIYTTWGIK